MVAHRLNKTEVCVLTLYSSLLLKLKIPIGDKLFCNTSEALLCFITNNPKELQWCGDVHSKTYREQSEVFLKFWVLRNKNNKKNQTKKSCSQNKSDTDTLYQLDFSVLYKPSEKSGHLNAEGAASQARFSACIPRWYLGTNHRNSSMLKLKQDNNLIISTEQEGLEEKYHKKLLQLCKTTE